MEVIDLPSPTTAFVRLVAPNSNSTNSAFAKPTASLTSSNANSGDQTTNNQNCSVEGTVPISCLKRPPSGFRSQNDIAGNFKKNFNLICRFTDRYNLIIIKADINTNKTLMYFDIKKKEMC